MSAAAAAKTKQQHEQYEKERTFLRELLIACEKDEIEKVRELSKSHPICDYRDGKRAGAVHAACRGASLRVLKFLVSLRPEQAALKDAENRTPIMSCMFAHEDNAAKCVDFLLGCPEALATVEHTTVNGVRAVHFAASLDHSDCLQVLLSKGKCDAAAPSPAGLPLAWAVAHAHSPSTTQLLLQQQGGVVDVNATSSPDEPSCLLMACLQNKFDIAKVLVQHGAKLDQFTQNLSPLHACCASGAVECAQLLLAAADSASGVPPLCGLRDPVDGHLPIDVAIELGHAELARLLLPLTPGADHARDVDQWILEVKQKHVETHKINLELQAKADALAQAEKDLANAIFAQGDFAKAAEQYLATAKQHGHECSKPVLAVLYSNAAACFLKLVNFAEAQRCARLATEADPTHAKSFMRLGLASTKLGDHEAAARAFWGGHEADKSSPEAAKFIALFKEEIDMAKKQHQSEEKKLAKEQKQKEQRELKEQQQKQ